MTNTFPDRLQSWIETLGIRLKQDGVSKVDETVSSSRQLLNQHYSTFGPNAHEPQIGATEEGIGFTFKLGNITLLGEVIGNDLHFETMNNSYKLKGDVFTVLPLLIDYLERLTEK